MSLLSNLTLVYETLADDPIELGIRRGHSVLSALSARLVPYFPEPALETATAHSYRLPVTERVIQNTTEPAITTESFSPALTSSSRARQITTSYTPRGFKSRTTQAYTPRQMVGAL